MSSLVIINQLIKLFEKPISKRINKRAKSKKVILSEKRIVFIISYFYRILLSISNNDNKQSMIDIIMTYLLSGYKLVKNKTVLEIQYFKSEYIENNKHDISLKYGNDFEMKSIAMFINKCNNITVYNNKRIKGITIENCNNCHFILTDIITKLEIIRSNNCKIEILNKVPTMTLDYCQNCVIKLNKSLLNYKPDICTSQMNILYFEFDKELVNDQKIDNKQQSNAFFNDDGNLVKCINYSSQFNTSNKEKKKYHRTIVNPTTLDIHTNVLKLCVFP